MSKNQPERIELTFDLHDLPTAQHRAGLAGMLLLIESMKRRKLPEKTIPWVEKTLSTSATVSFSSTSLQGVLDDVYSATKEVRLEKKQRKDKKTKQFIPTDGTPVQVAVKGKEETRYPYLATMPLHQVLSTYMTDNSEGNPWIKLWRVMVWSIPRGNPKSRGSFDRRAENLHCKEGGETWKKLVELESARRKSPLVTAPLTSSLLLASQEVNAEAVPFLGRVEHNLLLHFWQVVVMTYVPRVVSDKEKEKKKEPGFVLAIPDVSDLLEFITAFQEHVGTLRSSRHGKAIYPPEAMIDLPAQSSLEFLRSLRNLAQSKARLDSPARGVFAVESFHMLKPKNDKRIKLLAFDRVANRPALIGQYEAIVRSFRNPLFRAARMRALLRDQPWYSGMLELFSERPWPFFVESEKTPRFLPRFGGDARKQFRGIYQDTRDMSTEEMSDDQRLARIVQRLINKYVEGRAEAKIRKKVQTFKSEVVDGKKRVDYPPEFREAQQRVCSDAFLAMRSRHDQDFVAYFAGSICSVAQFLPPGDYKFLTGVLLTRQDPNPVGPKALSWEDVKALAMIAVSACSFFAKARDAVAS